MTTESFASAEDFLASSEADGRSCLILDIKLPGMSGIELQHQIVATILQDLDQLTVGSVLKLPLADLPSSKEKIRSALNRAIRKARRNVATASDDNFLYLWNVSK